MIRNRVLTVAFVVLCCATALTQAGKVERIAALADAKSEIVSALEGKGYRAAFGGTQLAEIWLAKNVPDAKTGNTSAVYPQFAKGEFVGVIKFLTPAKDFRGQEIKPGTYTMRYDLLPTDGNHMGVAAQPDFVLLVPVIEDFDPTKIMAERVLINLGKRSSGTSHPAIFSMMSAGAANDFPSLFKSEDGFDVFAAKMNVGGKETPIAIVLNGHAAQ